MVDDAMFQKKKTFCKHSETCAIPLVCVCDHIFKIVIGCFDRSQIVRPCLKNVVGYAIFATFWKDKILFLKSRPKLTVQTNFFHNISNTDFRTVFQNESKIRLSHGVSNNIWFQCVFFSEPLKEMFPCVHTKKSNSICKDTP